MIEVGTVGYTRRRVPVDSVVCFQVVFGDVVVEVTLFSSLFVFVESRGLVSGGLTDISGLAEGAFDLINYSWFVLRFFFALNIGD